MNKEDLKEIITLIRTGYDSEIIKEKYRKLTIDEFKELKALIKEEFGKKPRTSFYKSGKQLAKNEMSQEELEEYRLGVWWLQYSNENIFLRTKNDNKFNEYINWVIEHKDKETERYIYPRTVISRNRITLRNAEMTEEEIKEKRLGNWWYMNPYERIILEKYKDVTKQEFMNLPEKIQNILLVCNRYGIKPECKILQQIKLCVKDNVETNNEIRDELERLVLNFNKEENIER